MSCEIDESIILWHNPSIGVIFLVGNDKNSDESIFLFLKVFFSEENCIGSPYLLFIAKSFSWDNSVKITFWIMDGILYYEIDGIFCYVKNNNTTVNIFWWDIATNIYLFKVNKRNTRKSCEICSRLTITVFLLLTLNIFHTFF